MLLKSLGKKVLQNMVDKKYKKLSLYLCTDHVECGYEVSWAVYQVSATGDGRLVEIHGIRVFETGVPRGLAVYGHQVVVKHGNNGLRLLLFGWSGH